MIQRVLNSKNFLAVLLALVTGTALYFKVPWPMTASLVPQTWNEYFLRLIALRDPWTYAALKASYHVMLFTTPYIGYSFLLSALYIFTLRPRRSPVAWFEIPAIEIVSNIESKFCSAINIQKANAPRIAKFYNAPTKREGHRVYLALRLDNNTRITPTGYDESGLSLRNLSTCTHL